MIVRIAVALGRLRTPGRAHLVVVASLALGIGLSLAGPPQARAAFAVEGLDVSVLKSDSTPDTAAGTHPATFHAHLDLETESGADRLRNLNVALPPSFLVNPEVIDECDDAEFATPRTSPYESSASGESCSNSSQLGVVTVHTGTATRTFGLFNLVPPFGAVASIGASPFGMPMRFDVHLSEPDNLSLDLSDIPESLDPRSLDLTIWGAPWEGTGPVEPGKPIPPTGHNPLRGDCLNEQTGGSYGNCLVFDGTPAPGALIKSYLTLPTTPCGTSPVFTASATSWTGAQSSDTATIPVLEKCNKPLTTPKLQLMTDNAAARTGLAINLTVNDGGGILNPGGTARPALNSLVASLPEGLTVNPSLGAGLGTCTEADFARETFDSEPEPAVPTTRRSAQSLSKALSGSRNRCSARSISRPRTRTPTTRLIGIYMLARNPRRGIMVKSRGHLEPDPHTGQLVGTFEQLPRLLYTHFNLTLREGQRSTFISPNLCGSYLTDVQFSSWAGPAIFHESSVFLINHGVDGGPCPTGDLPPFAPGLLAGSLNPSAAVHTPFDLRMTRTDADQEITSYSATLPPGLLANISGIPFCSDAAIDAARARTGLHGAQEELEAPSCPAASLIGHTTAGYGVGGTLAWAPGSLYLAGPYHGSPISTVAIDSALIGPFDLGVVVVRSAIRVDPRTSQVSIDSTGSDPIPHIIRGIPIHLRDIRVHVDRPDFTLNPTSCDPSQVVSNLTGAGADLFSPADDPIATSTDRYQLLNCSLLPFKPKLKFRFTSGFKRRAFPSLRTELRGKPGRRQPSLRGRHPATHRVHRPGTPAQHLREGPVRGRSLPPRLGLRKSESLHSAPRRTAGRPGLPAVFFGRWPARHGLRPQGSGWHPHRSRRQDRLRPRKPARHLQRPTRCTRQQGRDDPQRSQAGPDPERKKHLQLPPVRQRPDDRSEQPGRGDQAPSRNALPEKIEAGQPQTRR